MAPAIPHPPTLDGVHLTGADAESWDVQNPVLKRVRQAQNGPRREAYAFNGAGKALLRTSLVVTIDWASLGTMKSAVEELISVPGPHELVLWRPELKTFAGDGSRREWTLPWRLAIDVVEAMPSGVPESRFYPVVKVGRTGAPLTYVSKSAADYAGDEPAAEEVWFLEGGTTFKVATPPAAESFVYAWVVPVFEVFDSGENAKKFSDPIREPRRLTLQER